MRWQSSDRETPLWMALLIWLCALPVVMLLAGPWLGTKAALGIAVGLLLALLTICWMLCVENLDPNEE